MLTKYLMRFDQTNVTELAWEYHYEMTSQKMAIDYATGHAMQLNRPLVIFYEDAEGHWHHLASIRVKNTVTAEVT